MSKVINIIGKKFNRLTVLSFSHKNDRRQYFYNCICECGNKCIINGYKIRSGYTKSCGCFKSENGKKQIENNRRTPIKHGDYGTRFYNIWNSMKQRCNYRKSISYKNYGKRGIKICNDWLGYHNFKEDMYRSYCGHVEEYGERQTTLDRINNNGDYCKQNCRWATFQEQQNNTSRNKFIKHNGKTLTAMQWSRELSISVNTIYSMARKSKDGDDIFLNSSFKIGDDGIKNS